MIHQFGRCLFPIGILLLMFGWLFIWGGCKNQSVEPPAESSLREFVVPQSVGTTWEFLYADYYFDAERWETTLWGNNTWVITSKDSTAGGTVLQINEVRHDSLYKHDVYEFLSDTTRVRVDTVLFAVVITSDSIDFRCPEMHPEFRRIARYSLQTSDTLTLREQYPCEVTSIFLNHVGLVNYSFHYKANHDKRTSMKLIAFVFR